MHTQVMELGFSMVILEEPKACQHWPARNHSYVCVQFRRTNVEIQLELWLILGAPPLLDCIVPTS